jgi:cell division transport system permease protein
MYALREALAAIRRAPILTALSAAMVAFALFVVGLFGLVTYNLQQALVRVEERVEVIGYLTEDATQEEVTAVREVLLELEEVRAVRHISKEEALRLASEDIPEFREIFVGLEANPLPASLEVELHPGSRTPDAVAQVAAIASLYDAFEEVTYGQEWVSRLYLLRRVGGVAATILGLAFAVVAALIIATAIRIAIFARADEIRIMRLVGATNGFVRRPFLLEGFLTGALGGALAIAMTYVAYVTGNRMVLPLDWIPTTWVSGGALGGAFFGVLASSFAIRRYLREV